MLAVILIKPKSSHWKLLIHFCNNHAIQYNSTADLAAIHYILSLNYTWCTCDVMLHGMVYIRKNWNLIHCLELQRHTLLKANTVSYSITSFTHSLQWRQNLEVKPLLCVYVTRVMLFSVQNMTNMTRTQPPLKGWKCRKKIMLWKRT